MTRTITATTPGWTGVDVAAGRGGAV